MSFGNYIKDRLGFIVVYNISSFLIILVMKLSLIIEEKRISTSNVAYAFLLSIVLLAVFLYVDYLRLRALYKSMKKAVASNSDFDAVLSMTEGKSSEQRLFQQILHNNYKQYKNLLSKYEYNQKQYTIFINQWVHQMKTPVSVINLLLQDAKDNKGDIICQSIAEETEKLSHGLDIMLNNARLSQFNLDFHIEAVNIADAVRSIINDHKKSLIKYSIYPKIIGNDDTKVETDKKWISFVINQIVINAIKYTKITEKENKAILIEITDQEDKIILKITDTGIGIPREDISRVFNAFFTGKNGRKTPESTGMGMYLSKRVCDELGHELSVESEEGKGASFSIVFTKGKSIYKILSKM